MVTDSNDTCANHAGEIIDSSAECIHAARQLGLSYTTDDYTSQTCPGDRGSVSSCCPDPDGCSYDDRNRGGWGYLRLYNCPGSGARAGEAMKSQICRTMPRKKQVYLMVTDSNDMCSNHAGEIIDSSAECIHAAKQLGLSYTTDWYTSQTCPGDQGSVSSCCPDPDGCSYDDRNRGGWGYLRLYSCPGSGARAGDAMKSQICKRSRKAASALVVARGGPKHAWDGPTLGALTCVSVVAAAVSFAFIRAKKGDYGQPLL